MLLLLLHPFEGRDWGKFSFSSAIPWEQNSFPRLAKLNSSLSCFAHSCWKNFNFNALYCTMSFFAREEKKRTESTTIKKFFHPSSSFFGTEEFRESTLPVFLTLLVPILHNNRKVVQYIIESRRGRIFAHLNDDRNLP